MVVHLQHVKKKFATLVDEVQPAVMSQFVIWLDEKVAEFKVQGTMHLDTDFNAPKWLREYSLSMMLSVSAAYNANQEASSRDNTPSPVNVETMVQATRSSSERDGSVTRNPHRWDTTSGVSSASLLETASGDNEVAAQSRTDASDLNFSSFAQNSALSGFIAEGDRCYNNDVNRKSQKGASSDQIDNDNFRETERTHPNSGLIKSERVDLDMNSIKSEPDNSGYECASDSRLSPCRDQAEGTPENRDEMPGGSYNSNIPPGGSTWPGTEHSQKRKRKFPNPAYRQQSLASPILSSLADSVLSPTDLLSKQRKTNSSVFHTNSSFTQPSWISSSRNAESLSADAAQQSLETVYPNNALFTNIQDAPTSKTTSSLISSQIDPTSMAFLHKQLMSESAAVDVGDSSFYSNQAGHKQSDMALMRFDSSTLPDPGKSPVDPNMPKEKRTRTRFSARYRLYDIQGNCCKICGKTFAGKNTLLRHLRSGVHKIGESQRQACKICNREYSRKDAVLRHLRRIHGLTNEMLDNVTDWEDFIVPVSQPGQFDHKKTASNKDDPQSESAMNSLTPAQCDTNDENSRDGEEELDWDPDIPSTSRADSPGFEEEDHDLSGSSKPESPIIDDPNDPYDNIADGI